MLGGEVKAIHFANRVEIGICIKAIDDARLPSTADSPQFGIGIKAEGELSSVPATELLVKRKF